MTRLSLQRLIKPYRPLIFLAAFGLLLAGSAPTPGFGLVRAFGSGLDSTSSIAVGDVNGDGSLDIVAANLLPVNGVRNAVYLNDGLGNFDASAAQQPFGPLDGDTRNILLADLNGDGSLDIITTGASPGVPNVIYLNDGHGHFYSGPLSCSSPPPGVKCFGALNARVRSLVAGDFNGDGSYDLGVIYDSGSQNAIYLNDGQANFSTLVPIGSANQPTCLAAGDVNHDHTLDLVVADNGHVTVYLNDGHASFSAQSLAAPTGGVDALMLGDVKGEGSLDLVAGNSFGLWIYFNDGAGNYFLATPSGFGHPAQRLALADIDGDGRLDIVAGRFDGVGSATYPLELYLNSGAAQFRDPSTLAASSNSAGLQVADLNGNGHLDVAVGGYRSDAVYFNSGGGQESDSNRISFSITPNLSRLALGDLNGDGSLDLAAASGGFVFGASGPAVVLTNNGSGVFSDRHTVGGSSAAVDVALADFDGDGRLDLAVAGASGQKNAVFLNQGAGEFSDTAPGPLSTSGCAGGDNRVRCFGSSTDRTAALAVGDVNGDGALDLVVGNNGSKSAVYINDGAAHFPISHTFDLPAAKVLAVALGDLNGDGNLDLVACKDLGSGSQLNSVYINDGAGGFNWPGAVRYFGFSGDICRSVALGDLNGDGALDIVVGNYSQQNYIYLNDGSGHFDGPAAARPFGSTTGLTTHVALADVDGDGHLDILVGRSGGYDEVYLNDGSAHFNAVRQVGSYAMDTTALAVGDLNGDGSLDILVGNQHSSSQLYLNTLRLPPLQPSMPPHLKLAQPLGLPDAPFFSSPRILTGRYIPITYTLFQDQGRPVEGITAEYSPDGGGRWLPALPAPGTLTSRLSAAPPPAGRLHTFTWDTFQSKFYGQADSLIFRIRAVPDQQAYTATVPGPYQWPYAVAATSPFRVRGSQVRVISSTLPVADAIVYRLPVGGQRAEPYRDSAGALFHTNSQGFLQDHGEIQFGDRLAALLPITTTGVYTLYYTSAPPTPTGLDLFTVSGAGVQTLTVSSANPLVLFNLDVSLQWDVRSDERFTTQLDYNLQRASELLYRWSNGQAALGRVTVAQNRQGWNDANVRVYASNRLHPMALKGGLVIGLLPDKTVPGLSYSPGQVHIGAAWNRYGDPGTSINDDWARALAHELGHYLLFLDDNYLGLDDAGQLVPVDTCTGVMADPYRQDFPYDQFHPQAGWLPSCAWTLSQRTTGRSDWSTITTFYPWLDGSASFVGPSSLPLAVTELRMNQPVTPTAALADPTFFLTQDGARIQPGVSARGFLYQDGWAIDLGRPSQDRLLARGARPGDQVCLYDPVQFRLGCQVVTSSSQQFPLTAAPGWQPDILISPVNSTTVAVRVSQLAAGLDLSARLYPLNGPSAGELTLAHAGDVYTGVFHLAAPIFDGYLRLSERGADPALESITDFTIGGNPTYQRGSGTYQRGSGTYQRGSGGFRYSSQAPVTSSDGRLVLFFDDSHLGPDQFFTVQALSTIPSPPLWATLVGQAYRLTTSANAPDLSKASLAATYMGAEVPSGEEPWLRLYYWDGQVWRPLQTHLDTTFNSASARALGPGVYALLSSYSIPLDGPGWNVILYPLQETRPVTQALVSLAGYYTTIYGADSSGAWKMYDTGAPSWADDLSSLEYFKSYWINVTQPVTWYLSGRVASPLLRPAALPPGPPATYYGQVLPANGFQPQAGLPVTAWFGSQLCGQGLTQLHDGQVDYLVHVLSDAEQPGCGAPGRQFVLRVDGVSHNRRLDWENSRAWRLPFNAERYLYFPLARRR